MHRHATRRVAEVDRCGVDRHMLAFRAAASWHNPRAVNVVMWGKALRVIPRVSKEQWDELDPIARWLIATRSAVLVMTAIAATLAGLLAWRDGAFDPLVWLALLAGLVLAHATNNLLNDLTDHARGLDRGNYFRAQYGPQPLEHGLMTRAQLIRQAAITGALALAAGGYLVWLRGTNVLVLLGIGVFLVLFYTWPLKLIGLGELAVLAVWGPLMVGGGYYVLAGRLDMNVIVASLPFGLAATTVIFGKHIDKLSADRERKVRTLPVLLGERASRWTTIAMLLAQYAVVVGLVVSGYFGPLPLLVVAAAPALWRAVQAYRHPRPEEPPARLPAGVWPLWFVAFAFVHTRRFGALYIAGVALDAIVARAGWL
jgi:1,4-dihydroxy-2-naphthoate octaprenyltransferase